MLWTHVATVFRLQVSVIGRHFEAIVQDCRYCGVKQKLENGQGRGLELSINAHTTSIGTI